MSDTGCRIFLEGRSRSLLLQTPLAVVQQQLNGGVELIRVRNQAGEDTLIARGRIVSVVENKSQQVVDVTGALWGKQVKVHGMHPEDAEPTGVEYDASLVVVECEDLGREIALVLTEGGAVVYRNPADPDNVTERLVRVAKLCAEAVALFTAAYEPEAPQPIDDGVGLTEDQQYAVAFLERGLDGDRGLAVGYAGEEFVNAFEQSRAFDAGEHQRGDEGRFVKD